MQTTKDSLVLHNVNQYFNKANLFTNPVSLEVHPGHITMLYGRSGTGKSALFDMMSYMVAPQVGQVFWDGEEITSLKEANKKRSKIIGMLFSNFSFISLLSIKENIMLAAALKNKPNLETKLQELCDGILKFDDEDSNLDLTNLISKSNVNELSNGQKEIISLASALLTDSKYLLVDELLRSFPDETKIKIFKRLLAHFKEKNTGLFYISHWKQAMEVMDSMQVPYTFHEIKNNELITYNTNKEETK